MKLLHLLEPEEFIGGLWHRFITRAATRSYPQAAVRLEDIERGHQKIPSPAKAAGPRRKAPAATGCGGSSAAMRSRPRSRMPRTVR